MSLTKEYQKEIISNIKHLPQEKLKDKKIVKLGGLWKGVKISDNEIKKARRKSWQKLDSKKIL